MMDADLRYEKSRENAGIRQSMWLPTLMVTTSKKLVLRHATRNKYGHYTKYKKMITLGWQWDSRPGAQYFYTSLTTDNLAEVLKLWSPYGRSGINVSKGVREWQERRTNDNQ